MNKDTLFPIMLGVATVLLLSCSPAKIELSCPAPVVKPAEVVLHLVSPTGTIEIGGDGLVVKEGGTMILEPCEACR